MFFWIFLDFNPTLKIPLSSLDLKPKRTWIVSQCLALIFTIQQIWPPTRPLRPVISNNTCPPCITAAAGTGLAGAYSSSNVIIFLDKRALQPMSLHHSRKIAGSGVSPLSNIPHCCLPKEFGPCLSPNVVDHPLRPTKDLRLGRPLPYQLP